MWVGSSLLPSQPGTQAPQYVYYCYFTTAVNQTYCL
jgi:hypothetical protein